jgi:hypothetical protein
MNLTRRLLLPVALVAFSFSSAAVAVADLIKCTDSGGCEVRLWDPENSRWGDPEDVPKGTIIDSAWGLAWGEGWQPV